MVKNKKGFSLVELVIAIALLAIVTTTIVTVFSVSTKVNVNQIANAENLMDIRHATTYLREQVRKADTVEKIIENGTGKLKITYGATTAKYYLENKIIYEKIDGGNPEPLIENVAKFDFGYSDDSSELLQIDISVENENVDSATKEEKMIMHVPSIESNESDEVSNEEEEESEKPIYWTKVVKNKARWFAEWKGTTYILGNGNGDNHWRYTKENGNRQGDKVTNDVQVVLGENFEWKVTRE